MNCIPAFVSVVIVQRNGADFLADLLTQAAQTLAPLASDYEIIVVDNASADHSIQVLRGLAESPNFPNLQVYALTKEVDPDTASWAGVENSLGDFVAIVDPFRDDVRFLQQMLSCATEGNDIVLALNESDTTQGRFYQAFSHGFNLAYRWLTGIHLAKDAPHYRLISRRVVNFILQHRQPTITYRHLPATGGFSKANLTYKSRPRAIRATNLMESIDRGMRLLVSTTRAPMRLVTILTLFGAVSNFLYSIYVICIALIKSDVAPGWVTLSLQQSGMFFLISLVLMVLGEYIIQVTSLSNEGPLYHIAQEFTSSVMTRNQRLNVEESIPGEAASRVCHTGETVA